MTGRFKVLLITIMILASLSFISYADEETTFRVFNPTAVTSDLDATYIQGEVKEAAGERIVVSNADGFVAEKVLPNNGKLCGFRIKLPKTSINTDKTTSFAVTATSAEGKRIKTYYVRITYKAKKSQEITADSEEYNLMIPGNMGAIAASSSSGLKLNFSSSDDSVVIVDENGNLEPVNGGSAEITISQKNSNAFEDAVKKVKVSVKEVPFYTVRYHLGKYTEADLESAESTDEDSQVIAVAGISDITEASDDVIFEQKIALDIPTNLLKADEKKREYEFLGWATTRTGYPSYENAQEVLNLAERDQVIDLYAVWHGERAQGAVEWGKKIAADNNFTYGKGYAGYFTCPICAGRHSKSDTKYTCMPFCAAAFAHGAEDPIMLGNGRHVMNLHDGNFKGSLGEVWEKIGLCSELTIDDLRPGDIVIKWSATNDNGHAWMYGGDDKVVEAVPSDIRVVSGAAAKLKRYGRSEGTPSKNYVMRYKY